MLGFPWSSTADQVQRIWCSTHCLPMQLLHSLLLTWRRGSWSPGWGASGSAGSAAVRSSAAPHERNIVGEIIAVRGASCSRPMSVV